MSAGVNEENRRLTAPDLKLEAKVSAAQEEVLYDPQTSGGLLLSVPEAEGDRLVSALREAGVGSAVVVGRVVENPGGAAMVVC